MKKIICVLMLSISGFAIAADSAGLFVEPMLTWERGRGDVNFPSPFNSAETELDGFGVGARLGAHVLGSVFLGVDGRYSMLTFKDDKLNQDADAEAWNVGPVVGVQMPTLLGLRVWGSYILAGEVDPDRSQSVDEKFKDGSGYRVGAGVKLGFVSVNIEYQHIKYDETLIEEVGIFTPNYSRSNIVLENDSTLLSVSFPVAI